MRNLQRIAILGFFLTQLTIVSGEDHYLGSLPSVNGFGGLKIDVSIESVGGSGYQPVYLKISPIGKSFRRDRNLSIAIRPRREYGSDFSYTLQTAIPVAEGSGATTVTMYLPNYHHWDYLNVSLNEDGQPMKHGSNSFYLGSNLRTQDAKHHAAIGVVVADRKTASQPWEVCPDVRTMVTAIGDGPLPEDFKQPRYKHTKALNNLEKVQPAWVQFRSIMEDQLHDSWLGYSQLDVLLVAAPILDRIESEQPEKFSELQEWLTAGGNIWVYAASKRSPDRFIGQLSTRPVVTAKFVPKNGINAHLDLNLANDNSPLNYEYWNGVQKLSTQTGTQTGNKLRRDVLSELKQAKHPFANTSTVQEIAKGLSRATFGLGKVLLIDTEDPFPGSFQFWKSIEELPDQTLTWSERTGVDVPAGNDNYWAWLIPAVGKPPVISFVVLNILFALLIGPICYLFLRKRERLYLLYFLAPAVAFLLTVTLFGYAAIVDGFKTTVRSRQITWVDSNTGVSVDQSRQTYYSVLGDSTGIVLPADRAMYPVRNTPMVQNRYYQETPASRRGVIASKPDVQQFSSGFLPPREQVQYLSTRPRIGGERITFDFEADPPTVSSSLPYALVQLVVCDKNRQYWKAGSIGSGEKVTLQSAKPSLLSKMLNAKTLPPLKDIPMLQRNANQNWGMNSFQPGVEVSILESKLGNISRDTALPVGTFLGTADLVIQRVGFPEAKITDSVHFIMGEVTP